MSVTEDEMAEVQITASWFECGWGEAYHRLAGLLWESRPPEDYLRKVDYIWERRNKAARREDQQRIAAGQEPLWNLE